MALRGPKTLTRGGIVLGNYHFTRDAATFLRCDRDRHVAQRASAPPEACGGPVAVGPFWTSVFLNSIFLGSNFEMLLILIVKLDADQLWT